MTCYTAAQSSWLPGPSGRFKSITPCFKPRNLLQWDSSASCVGATFHHPPNVYILHEVYRTHPTFSFCVSATSSHYSPQFQVIHTLHCSINVFFCLFVWVLLFFWWRKILKGKRKTRDKNLGREMDFLFIPNILLHEGRINTILKILKCLHIEATPSRQTIVLNLFQLRTPGERIHSWNVIILYSSLANPTAH